MEFLFGVRSNLFGGMAKDRTVIAVGILVVKDVMCLDISKDSDAIRISFSYSDKVVLTIKYGIHVAQNITSLI